MPTAGPSSPIKMQTPTRLCGITVWSVLEQPPPLSSPALPWHAMQAATATSANAETVVGAVCAVLYASSALA